MVEGDLVQYIRLNGVKMGESKENCKIFLISTSDSNYSVFVIDIEKADETVKQELRENFNSKLHLLLSQIS